MLAPHEAHRLEPGGFLAKPHEGQVTGFFDAAIATEGIATGRVEPSRKPGIVGVEPGR
jgi:hypothetical protein